MKIPLLFEEVVENQVYRRGSAEPSKEGAKAPSFLTFCLYDLPELEEVMQLITAAAKRIADYKPLFVTSNTTTFQPQNILERILFQADKKFSQWLVEDKDGRAGLQKFLVNNNNAQAGDEPITYIETMFGTIPYELLAKAEESGFWYAKAMQDRELMKQGEGIQLPFEMVTVNGHLMDLATITKLVRGGNVRSPALRVFSERYDAGLLNNITQLMFMGSYRKSLDETEFSVEGTPKSDDPRIERQALAGLSSAYTLFQKRKQSQIISLGDTIEDGEEHNGRKYWNGTILTP